MSRHSQDEQPTTVLQQPTAEQPGITTVPATRRMRIWQRKVPSRIGRARTSTVIIGCLFVLLSALNSALPQPDTGTTPVVLPSGQTVDVPNSALPSDARPTTTAPTTTAPTTTPPSTSTTAPRTTTEAPDTTAGAPGTTTGEPTTAAPGSTTAPRSQERTTPAPATSRAPTSVSRAPATTAEPVPTAVAPTS
jgi:hypothetical protein